MSIVHLAARHTSEKKSYIENRKSHNSYLYSTRSEIDVFELPLSVGDAYCDVFPAHTSAFTKVESDGIRLSQRSSVIIEVAESIEVPFNMFGIIFPKGSLATISGIAAPTTKIDPGFHGNLRILVSNTSSQSYILKQGDLIASAVFFSTALTVDDAITNPKEDIVAQVPPIGKRIKKWVSKNISTVVTTIIVPILAAAIGAAATLLSIGGQ